jgi:hypothetical protein
MPRNIVEKPKAWQYFPRRSCGNWRCYPKTQTGTLLATNPASIDQEVSMYDQRFFASKLGLSALVSIAAMVSFNLYALAQQPVQAAEVPAMAVETVELA